MRKDDQGSGEDTGTPETGNGTTDDKRFTGRCSTTDERAKFEDTDCREETPFETEVTVEFAVDQLEGAHLSQLVHCSGRGVKKRAERGGKRGNQLTVNMYPDPYQPTSSSAPNWSVILGMAVAMIVWSCMGNTR